MKLDIKFDDLLELAAENMLQEQKVPTALELATKKARQQAKADAAKQPKKSPVRFKRPDQYPNYKPVPPPIPTQLPPPSARSSELSAPPPPSPARTKDTGRQTMGGRLVQSFVSGLNKTFGTGSEKIAGIQRAIGMLASVDPSGYDPKNLYVLDKRDKNSIKRLNAILRPPQMVNQSVDLNVVTSLTEETEAEAEIQLQNDLFNVVNRHFKRQQTQQTQQTQNKPQSRTKTYESPGVRSYVTNLKWDKTTGSFKNLDTETTAKNIQYIYNVLTDPNNTGRGLTVNQFVGYTGAEDPPLLTIAKNLHEYMRDDLKILSKKGPVYYMTPEQYSAYSKETMSFGRRIRKLADIIGSTSKTAY